MKGLTLLEVLIACVIVGILATFAVPQFAQIKERALDKEAHTYLVSLQAAERIYRIEQAKFYPETGTVSDINDINDNLKVDLPQSGSWLYSVNITSSDPPIGAVEATRDNTGQTRKWTLKIIGAGEEVEKPSCSGDCPS